ncbi:hypothetical protein BCR39DRAFT_517997 [Naematelia encephala]|uniref:Uncharacterized protein n=1 Tax=Naematelia encephala TaxID=71784 RepID=A0A1Y2BGX1_9TREE|nr:hypothetical protein BCR39DRAFT_517997 [Naematelia encephala]
MQYDLLPLPMYLAVGSSVTCSLASLFLFENSLERKFFLSGLDLLCLDAETTGTQAIA